MNKQVRSAIKKNDYALLENSLPKATIHRRSTKLVKNLIETNQIYSAYYLLRDNGKRPRVQEFASVLNKMKYYILICPKDIKNLIMSYLDKTDLINLFLSSEIFHPFFDIPLILYMSYRKRLTPECIQYAMVGGQGISIDLVLVYACKHNFPELVDYTLDHGANIEVHKNEPLTLYCKSGNLEMVKCLINRGAQYTDHTWFPLKTAIYHEQRAIVSYIVNKLMSDDERLEFITDISLNVF